MSWDTEPMVDAGALGVVAWSHPRATLYQGDGIVGLAALAPGSVDALITDPPYGMMTEPDLPKSNGAPSKHASVIRRNIDFDHLASGGLDRLYQGLFASAVPALTTNAWVLVFCQLERIAQMCAHADAAGLHYRGPFIWHKTNPAPRIRIQGLCCAHEVAAIFTAGKPAFYGERQATCHSVVALPSEPACHRWHETQKSLKLMQTLVSWFCPIDGLVADPFAGSGQTLRACLSTGRRGVGWEIDEHRCAVDALALGNDLPAARRLAVQHGILLTSEAAQQPDQGLLFGED